MKIPRIVLVFLGASLGTAVAVGAHEVIPASPYVRGLRIGGEVLPARDAVPSWLAARRDAALDAPYTLRYAGQTFETTERALGITLDVAATLAAAESLGHEGTIFQRLRESGAAKRGEADVPLAWSIDEEQARRELARVGQLIAREPVNAQLNLDERRKVPDVPGLALDVDASLEVLREDVGEKRETTLIVREKQASVTIAELSAVDIEKVVASFETTFSVIGTGVGRSQNVRNAAGRIDGHVLLPGQVFSFNDVVGARTVENGFTFAPEIQGDELQTGVGGGTCQVSSTLYAAALFAALGVVERQGHSLVSSYTKLGLDATVSYPTTDLKLENTLPYPVMIHAYFPKPTTLRVEILGGEPVATVQYAYGVGSAYDFVRRITVRNELPPGKRVRRQKGSRGFDVTSTVKVVYKDGRSEERRYYTGYRPKPEVFWVGPGFDEAELPPLPEHAKGVEGRLSDARDPEASIYPM